MEDSGASVVAAKNLYTDQLIDLLAPFIYEGIKSIFDSCRKNDLVLKSFQEKLCSVIRWNTDIIDKEFKRILRKADESYINGLIDAVFVANVKVLSSIHMGKSKKIDIKVPTAVIFIHKAYVETARQMYQDPYLMDDRETCMEVSEIQRNVKRSKNIIGISIEKTIRDLIPIQDIIESYLIDIGLDDIKETIEDDIVAENESISSHHSNKSDDTGNESVSSEEDLRGKEDLFMKEPAGEHFEDKNNYPNDDIPGSLFEKHEDQRPDLEVTSGRSVDETPTGFMGNSINKKIFFLADKEDEAVPNIQNRIDDANFFSDSE